MEKGLQLIVKKYEYDFEDWYETIRNYQELSIIPYNRYWIDVAEKSPNIEDLLHQILEIFSGFSGTGTWTRGERLTMARDFEQVFCPGKLVVIIV